MQSLVESATARASSLPAGPALEDVAALELETDPPDAPPSSTSRTMSQVMARARQLRIDKYDGRGQAAAEPEDAALRAGVLTARERRQEAEAQPV